MTAAMEAAWQEKQEAEERRRAAREAEQKEVGACVSPGQRQHSWSQWHAV